MEFGIVIAGWRRGGGGMTQIPLIPTRHKLIIYQQSQHKINVEDMSTCVQLYQIVPGWVQQKIEIFWTISIDDKKKNFLL